MAMTSGAAGRSNSDRHRAGRKTRSEQSGRKGVARRFACRYSTSAQADTEHVLLLNMSSSNMPGWCMTQEDCTLPD